MKGTVPVLAFLLTLLFAASSFAADYGKTGGMKEKAAGTTSAVTTERAGVADQQLMSVNQLLGNRIENTQGENLGEINNVILDRGTGRIAYVMVNTGTFFSGEAKLVPYKALDLSGDRIRINMDKEKLADAPAWTEGSPAREFDRKSHEFFGVAPYWVE